MKEEAAHKHCGHEKRTGQSVIQSFHQEPGPAGEDSVFFREWLAGNRYQNQLPISAVCNSRCVFCSNNLNPFPIARGMFRDMEDIKHQLSLMPLHKDPIRMSDSLPGRIAEGEAFLHPKFFEILKLIRRKYITNKICFTTNGAMLDEAFLKELSRFRPIEINVSMHSSRPELWAKIFRKRRKDGEIAIASLPLLKKYKMELVGTIVPLPRICGWNDIENTYEYFAEFGAKSMILYWPGYTVCVAPETIEKLECPMEEFMEFSSRMRSRFNIPLSPYPDMRASLTLPVRTVMSRTLKGNLVNFGGAYRRVLWLTSEAAYGRITSALGDHGGAVQNSHQTFAVKNETYGGNIIVSGLLMVDDFIKAGKAALDKWPDTELVLVPKEPFDQLYRDLKGTPAYRISEEIGRPVWVVEGCGCVNPLLDRPFRKKEDQESKKIIDAMALFNTAFHDPTQIEKSLDMVDAYPLQTSAGDLTREELRDYMLKISQLNEKQRRPFNQRIEILDDARALCLENWPTEDESKQMTRWVFLVKRNEQWKIDRLLTGVVKPGEDVCRGRS
ncbi:MAG: radical SAM protein [Deltaproteobacteria bacterium]|nr:radical SAM protein [Deltaproteobacteria bacterium]